jgi:hypothetical protein
MVLSTIWTPGRVVASSYGLTVKIGSFVIGLVDSSGELPVLRIDRLGSRFNVHGVLD